MIMKFPKGVMPWLINARRRHDLAIVGVNRAGDDVPSPDESVQPSSVLHVVLVDPNREAPVRTIPFIAIG